MTLADDGAVKAAVARSVDEAAADAARGEDWVVGEAAAVVRETLDRTTPVGTPDDMAAAAEIRAWHLTLRAIGTAAETAVMRACFRIRVIHPAMDDFADFVYRQMPNVMTAKRAWLLADTWDVARKNRKLHELAASRPDRAVAFVRDFTDAVEAAGGAENLPLPLDEDDKEIAALLTAPPKKRHQGLRELVAARRAPRNHHPDDVERIHDLEAEREQRDLAGVSGEKKATRAQLLGKYREAATLLGEVASEVVHHLDGEKAIAEHSRQHLEISNDIAVTGVQGIAALMFTERGE